MISSKSFSREWIEFISQKYGYRDKALIEKVIRAFSLLEALVDSGVPLVFKGGSAILLLLKDGLNRLSIDVDVICPPGTDILKYLRNGIRRIESYMYQKPYYIENAICDSAKVAYLATCFEYGIKNVEKYSPEMDLTSFSMKGLPGKIQRLRKVFPEAYYYWAKVSDIVDLNSIIESEKD